MNTSEPPSAVAFYQIQERLQRFLDLIGWLSLFFSAAGIVGIVKWNPMLIWTSFGLMILFLLIGIIIALYRAQLRDRYYANFY